MKNGCYNHEDYVSCYIGIHEIPTKELRKVTNQSKTTSRQTCIQLLEKEDIHHLSIDVHKTETDRIHELWNKFKSFLTVNELVHKTNKRSVPKSTRKTIGTNQHRIYSRDLHHSTTNTSIRSRSLVLSDMSASNIYMNRLRIGKDLLLNGKPILKVINDTNDNISTMNTTMNTNQSIVDHVNTQVSYYESTVANNMYFMLNPEESTDIIELITPPTFHIVPLVFQRTFIEDNVVTFSIRIVYTFETPSIPPKIFRVKLPYIALQIDPVHNVKPFIPIRGIIKYTRNNKSYVSNPAQTYINLKYSDEHLWFQHTVQTLLTQIEFHILARYATDINTMNISYITPMRYDMINNKILTANNTTLIHGLLMQSGYMQWNLLKDRIELSLQLKLHMNPLQLEETDSIDKKIYVQLPIEADVHYRSINPYGYGSISMNDQFIVERPVIWIESTDQLTIDLNSVQTLFIFSSKDSFMIDIFVNIVYFTFTSRYVRQPMTISMNVQQVEDRMLWSDVRLSNAYEYVDQSLHLLNNYDMMVHVDIDRVNIQQRNLFSKYVHQQWIPIQELVYSMEIGSDSIMISNIQYYDAKCIQTNRKKMTTAHDIEFYTHVVSLNAQHTVTLQRLIVPCVQMNLNYNEHTPYIFTISFTIRDVKQIKDGECSFISHDKHQIISIKLIKCNKRYISKCQTQQPLLGIP